MEKKAALVVVGDIEGFFRGSEEWSDEAMFKRLNSLFEMVGEEAEKVHGRLVKLVGDAFMMELPYDSCDDAINYALSVSRTFYKDFSDMGTGITFGLSRGDVVAGEMGPKGDKRYDLIGKTVNRAFKYANQFRGVILGPQVRAGIRSEEWKLQAIEGGYLLLHPELER